MEFTAAGFPPGLHLVESFLSSEDALSGADDLVDGRGFRRWLADHDRPVDEVTAHDLGQGRRLRAVLRAAAVAHHDGDLIADLSGAKRELEAIPVMISANAEGVPVIRPAGPGVAGFFGELVVAVVDAESAGQWRRVKVCPVEDCQVAYYDRSKNQSRRWCSMAVCGNRAKTRTYYTRQTSVTP